MTITYRPVDKAYAAEHEEAAALPDPSPYVALKAALTANLGCLDLVHTAERLTRVDYDAATHAMTVTYRLHDCAPDEGIAGAGWRDARTIVGDVLASRILVQELEIVGTLGMIDTQGTMLGEQPAMTTTWTANTLRGIRREGVTDSGFATLAEKVWIDPVLQPRRPESYSFDHWAMFHVHRGAWGWLTPPTPSV